MCFTAGISQVNKWSLFGPTDCIRKRLIFGFLCHLPSSKHQPGNGTHYVKHLDSFSDKNTSNTPDSSRRLTFLYYLNSSCEGGQLRVHNIPKEYCNSHNNDDTDSSSTGYLDIEPTLGRLLVFRRYPRHCIHPTKPNYMTHSQRPSGARGPSLLLGPHRHLHVGLLQSVPGEETSQWVSQYSEYHSNQCNFSSVSCQITSSSSSSSSATTSRIATRHDCIS
jgi:hypothetical protein